MRGRRRERFIMLLWPACAAIIVGGCGVPGWVPWGRAETESAALDPAAMGARGDAAASLGLAAAGITADAVRQRVRSLAAAAPIVDYLAAEFHALGLEGAGDSSTFVQRLPADRVAAGAGDAGAGDDSDRSDAPGSVQPAAAEAPAPVSFHAIGPQGSAAPVFGREFFVRSLPATSASAPLVWAGVAAPARRAPGPEAAGHALAFYLPGDAPDEAWRAALSTAIQGSVAAGASAVMLVLDPEFSVAKLAAVAAEPVADAVPALVVGVHYNAALKIFRNGLRDLDQLRNGPNQLAPVTGTTLAWEVAGAAVGRAPDEGPRNVVAMLRGSDSVLEDTYVVFSAPLETLGSGNGAAALLELAAAFVSLPERPARSLIFLGAADAGTDGLGSQHFAANPPVEASRIIAGISVDGEVASATDTIAAVGQRYTTMGSLVEEIARAHPELNLTLAPDLSPEDDRFLRGDSFSFARAGVPAISFTTGLPSNTSGAGGAAIAPAGAINAEDARMLARVTQFIFHFGHALASRAERPIWSAEGRAAVEKNPSP